MKLVQLIISQLPAEKLYVGHPSELSKMVILFSPGLSYVVLQMVPYFELS